MCVVVEGDGVVWVGVVGDLFGEFCVVFGWGVGGYD